MRGTSLDHLPAPIRWVVRCFEVTRWLFLAWAVLAVAQAMIGVVHLDGGRVAVSLVQASIAALLLLRVDRASATVIA